jgi:hypothetical protein
MAWQANGRTALLESNGHGAGRPTESGGHSSPLSETLQICEAGDALVVSVRLAEGLLELRIPKAAIHSELHQPHHIPGCNPDATPC